MLVLRPLLSKFAGRHALIHPEMMGKSAGVPKATGKGYLGHALCGLP